MGTYMIKWVHLNASIVNIYFLLWIKQGPHCWGSNHSDCPGPSSKRSLSQRLISLATNWTAPSFWVGTALDSHMWSFLPQPPQKRAQWGHIDFCLTCVWPSWLHWEYCLTSVPLLPHLQKAYLQTALDWLSLQLPHDTLLLTELWRQWEHQIQTPSGVDVSPRVSGRTISLRLHISDSHSATCWQNYKGAKVCGGSGCNIKSKEQGFFFLIIIISSSSVSDRRTKDSFWSVQRWCQEII